MDWPLQSFGASERAAGRVTDTYTLGSKLPLNNNATSWVYSWKTHAASRVTAKPLVHTSLQISYVPRLLDRSFLGR